MARPTTLPAKWLDLANAVGGIETLRALLGWPTMVFYRRARGLVKIPRADRIVVEQIATQHKVPSPVDPPSAPPLVVDLKPLEFLGQALARGFPPSKTEAEKLVKHYGEDVLVRLAEQDTTSPDALRAIAHLL